MKKEGIKSISGLANSASTPNIIYKELARHGDERSFHSYTDENGERQKVYGELIVPYRMHFQYGKFDFFCLEKAFNLFEYSLTKGSYFDSNLNQLNKKTITPFYEEYGRGFHEGYNGFETKIKNQSDLFNITNEQRAYKVFSRVWGGLSTKTGGFAFTGFGLDTNEKIEKQYGVSFPSKITKPLMYESGFGGGEFYKAWSIILENPTLFEPIFKDKTQRHETINEEPSIDLSDTKGTEKIIYLQKLGVLDFLKDKQPFSTSTNSLASVLSAITGENQSTINPMINPIFNPNNNQKNNPLNTQKTVEKVDKQLINIGFNPNKNY